MTSMRFYHSVLETRRALRGLGIDSMPEARALYDALDRWLEEDAQDYSGGIDDPADLNPELGYPRCDVGYSEVRNPNGSHK